MDYHYAMYYPLGAPYVPLFPRKEGGQNDGDSDEETDNEKNLRGDHEMRERIEKAMGGGKPALERLKNELSVEEILDEDISKPKEKGDELDEEED